MSDWIEMENGIEYKDVTTNGYWNIVRFRGDAAIYSWCPRCGHVHPCYKEAFNKEGHHSVEYAPEMEFIYCPMCGAQMLEEINENM